MKMDLEGTVHGVWLAQREDTLVSTPVDRAQVTLDGFTGDKHSGPTMRSIPSRVPYYPRDTEVRNTRQVSIVSLEELAQVAAALEVPELQPCWLGANLALLGIPRLTLLPPSTRLFFPDDAVLVIEVENKPCVWPGKIIQAQYPHLPRLETRFPKAAARLRGLVGWVERGGSISPGDPVRFKLPAPVCYSLPQPV